MSAAKRSKVQAYYRQKKYGMSVGEYNSMLDLQGGFCAICGGENGGRVLFVDHDHRNGLVRGLLCKGCNSALGYINDDWVVAQRMAKYLSGETALRLLFGEMEFPAVALERIEEAQEARQLELT